jgi:nucleoside-diphosphate-sugar epimerase
MTDAPLAAVTGGTGFLGRHVVAALARGGWRVRMLVRRDIAPPAEAPLAEMTRGDLSDAEALRRLVRGAAAVVHLAGLTKALRRAEFVAVNRDGSARLAQAVAAEAPAARCVLLSSMAARAPHLSAYAGSKQAGEAAAIAGLGAAGRWVVLRPGVIYGPGDREGRALRRLLAAPLAPVPHGPEPRIGFVHARDVAAAVARLCGDGPLSATFEVTDECREGYAWSEILRRTGALIGCAPRLLKVPDAALLLAGTAADAWSGVTRRPNLFGRGKAREMLHRDWSSAAERQLPAAFWAPRIPLEAGLRETVAWWNAPGPARMAPSIEGRHA